MEKVCSKCKIPKNIKEFNKNRSKNDGLNSYCKLCHRQFVKNYDKTNEKRKKYKAKKQRDYSKNPEYKFKKTIKDSIRRKRKFNLTFEEYMTFWQKPCSYCNNQIDTIGLDRVDNNKGYQLDNIVSCCSNCNYGKNNKTKEEYFNHCKQVVIANKLL